MIFLGILLPEKNLMINTAVKTIIKASEGKEISNGSLKNSDKGMDKGVKNMIK